MPAPAPSRPPTACLRSPRTGAGSAPRPVQATAHRSLQPQRWGGQAGRQAAARRLCRATAEKEGSTQQQEGQPKVPDTPPAPTGAAQQQRQQPTEAASSESVVQTETMSIEEIQRRAGLMRQQKAAAEQSKKGGSFLEGVQEEVRLIKWPAPGKAALNTVLVIGIVAFTGAMLLAINTAMTELSNVIY